MTSEHAHGEQIEDAIADEQAIEAVKREAAKIEAALFGNDDLAKILQINNFCAVLKDDELLGRFRSDTDRLQHGSADADAAVDSE